MKITLTIKELLYLIDLKNLYKIILINTPFNFIPNSFMKVIKKKWNY